MIVVRPRPIVVDPRCLPVVVVQPPRVVVLPPAPEIVLPHDNAPRRLDPGDALSPRERENGRFSHLRRRRRRCHPGRRRGPSGPCRHEPRAARPEQRRPSDARRQPRTAGAARPAGEARRASGAHPQPGAARADPVPLRRAAPGRHRVRAGRCADHRRPLPPAPVPERLLGREQAPRLETASRCTPATVRAFVPHGE